MATKSHLEDRQVAPAICWREHGRSIPLVDVAIADTWEALTAEVIRLAHAGAVCPLNGLFLKATSNGPRCRFQPVLTSMLTWLSFFCLGQHERNYAIAHLSVDLVFINSARNSKASPVGTDMSTGDKARSGRRIPTQNNREFSRREQRISPPQPPDLSCEKTEPDPVPAAELSGNSLAYKKAGFGWTPVGHYLCGFPFCLGNHAAW